MARRYKGGRPQNVCFRNLKGFKYYFANAHKMGFYGAFSVASLFQAV